MSDKPWACRFGIHSWFTDAALVNFAIKCNYCPKVRDRQAAARLTAERARIDALPAGATMAEVYRAALSSGDSEDGT